MAEKEETFNWKFYVQAGRLYGVRRLLERWCFQAGVKLEVAYHHKGFLVEDIGGYISGKKKNVMRVARAIESASTD